MPAESRLLPVLVGTAGHVDHGKTALVELLTGCCCDTLPEERARGLTIDLGFASCPLPGRRRVGIVDVPGHEDFIRNMVAGASAVDVLLLVVAADDGVMAQTIEHLRIVRHFSQGLAMAALTKIDLVDAEMVEVARQEVSELLAANGYADAPVVPVSNRSGEGIDRVREALDALVAQRERRAVDERAFRMYVERSFQLPGRGSVATGVPLSGRLVPGAALELLPGGRQTALRGLQCFGAEGEATLPGTCNALLLRDCPVEELARGRVLAAPGAYRCAEGLIVEVLGINDSLGLKRRQELRLHVGTTAVRAVCKLLDVERLAGGERCFAHLQPLEEAVIALGDRLLLRGLNPQASLAAATVLGDRAAKVPKRREETTARLRLAAAALAAGDRLSCAMLADEILIWSRSEAELASQLPHEEAARAVETALADGRCRDLGAGRLIHRERCGELAQILRHRLEVFHRAHPSTWGMDASQACAPLDVPAACFEQLARALADHGLAKRHGRLALEVFSPSLSQQLLQLRERLWRAIEEGGVQAPALGTLQQGFDCRKADLQQVLRLLQEEGLVSVYGNSLLDARLVVAARAALIAHCRASGSVDMAGFRELSGFSRNLAVAVLDRFDQEGLTRREGDRRFLLREA